MRLVRAEAERLAARRFVQLMVVLLVLAFGITAATTLADSHQPTASELASAERQAVEAQQSMEDSYRNCVAVHQGSAPQGQADEYPEDCSFLDPAQQERLPVAGDFLYNVFTFADEARPLLFFLIAFLLLFGFLVGASYVGADLNSGGVVNLLLWRPRRLAVLGAKLGTLLGGVLLLSVLASAAYLATFWLIGQWAGRPGRLDDAFWRSLGGLFGRGLLLVLLGTAVGFAIATLGRHTAAALGAAAGYVVVWEGGARVVMEILDVRSPERWVLSSYVGAWLNGRIQFSTDVVCYGRSDCSGVWSLTAAESLPVLLTVAAVLVVAAFAVFRRRDLI
ncbi:ABC transporter permease subunit [Micromonospora mirobrigensis]|uniref:ABC-2 family transporter protein n=1 Tax=Micromonospora mirobrigensis TaxID=262898 RepID=A0A1C4U6N3_9ACTN|nr:ABC transporter permease subunit [Micromonospora mirobrigensis]SCE67370.1 ABC-2 family transporter protein [Micromonospora mirobrigensis]